MTHSLRAHGKAILAGEHSVVRGGEAVVLPLRSRALTLEWEHSGSGVTVEPGPLAEPFRLSLDKALSLLSFTLPSAGYRIRLASDIPVRAGLGSSAALAVSVVRFLQEEGAKIPSPLPLAIEIENLFHGKSSGIDVACVLASAPVTYVKGHAPVPVTPAWKPSFYLFDTGQRSATKDCVAKVERAARPDLDRRMEECVRLVKGALLSESTGRLGALAEALELGASCFEEWGLGPGPALKEKLKHVGALAVKPTGSGGGGHLLTLWESEPPAGLGLLPVW